MMNKVRKTLLFFFLASCAALVFVRAGRSEDKMKFVSFGLILETGGYEQLKPWLEYVGCHSFTFAVSDCAYWIENATRLATLKDWGELVPCPGYYEQYLSLSARASEVHTYVDYWVNHVGYRPRGWFSFMPDTYYVNCLASENVSYFQGYCFDQFGVDTLTMRGGWQLPYYTHPLHVLRPNDMSPGGVVMFPHVTFDWISSFFVNHDLSTHPLSIMNMYPNDESAQARYFQALITNSLDASLPFGFVSVQFEWNWAGIEHNCADRTEVWFKNLISDYPYQFWKYGDVADWFRANYDYTPSYRVVFSSPYDSEEIEWYYDLRARVAWSDGKVLSYIDYKQQGNDPYFTESASYRDALDDSLTFTVDALGGGINRAPPATSWFPYSGDLSCIEDYFGLRASDMLAYEENAESKYQYGNSWISVEDSSSDSGMAMKASAYSPNEGWLFGPYINKGWDGESMLGKPYTATFRLKALSNAPANSVAYIDVAYNAGTVLQSALIKAMDFASANTWQDFQLNFTAPSSLVYGLEFRVQNRNNGVTDVYIDRIRVRQNWNASSVYFEGAYNKPQSGTSWTCSSDSSSCSGLVMKASASSQDDAVLFGPYINESWNGMSMLGKPYTATFTLKVSSNMKASDVVNIDVCYDCSFVLTSLKLRASDFVSSNTWQDFQLGFIVPSSLTYGLEFRVRNLNNGITDIFVDRIFVEQGISAAYSESAYTKPQFGDSWSSVDDSSSLSGIVMKAPASSANGGCLFGPYLTWDEPSMFGKPCMVTFRLKASSNLRTDNLVYLDVYSQGTVLTWRVVNCSDFSTPNTWQEFALTFVAPSNVTSGLEFRVVNLNNGVADLCVDNVIVSVE